MNELFFCPGCGGVINMNAAVCSACGADISAFTGVKRKGTPPERPRPETDESVENEEVDEEEDVDEEEEIDEKDAYQQAKTPAQKQGGAFGRWIKRIFFLGISAFGVWAFQEVGGIEGLKSVLSTDGNPVAEQTGGGQPSGEGIPTTDQTGTLQPTEDNMADLVNSPEGGNEAIAIGDFAGEWNPENLNPGKTDRIAMEHVIIRHDESGNMVIYFKGFENVPALLNYTWSAIEGRKVKCVMSYKDDAENRGAVLMELSGDKHFLQYSTLDKNTMSVLTTHKFKRMQ
jgi:hypothetical protein